MFTHVLAVLHKDLRVSRRDSVVTYLFLGPILLVLLARFTLPMLQRASGRPEMSEIIASLMAFSILLVIGLVAGFSIVDEKENGVLDAYAISPLTFREYLAAKLCAGILLGPLFAFAATLGITGLGTPLLPLFLALVASLPIGLVLGLLVGAFARDQLSAMAMLKGLLFFFASVPFFGFFLPAGSQRILWVFPNHWAVQSIFAALTGRPLASPVLYAFGTGSLALAGSVWVLRRRLGFGHQTDG